MTCHGIAFSKKRYARLLSDLADRGHGNRESGAFLLAERSAPRVEGAREIVAYALYDELDPDCLVGSIEMHPIGFSRLNALCRERGLEVVGDAHTHPHQWVQQSVTDANNPMSVFPGHVALIIPHFAMGPPAITMVGAHEYLGAGRWENHFGEDIKQVVTVVSTFALWRVRRAAKKK